MQLGSLIELNCYTEEGCICHIVFEIYFKKGQTDLENNRHCLLHFQYTHLKDY